MFVDYRGSVLGLIGWQWKYLAFFAAASAGVVAASRCAPPAWEVHLHMSALPIGVVGGAIGIFVSAAIR